MSDAIEATYRSQFSRGRSPKMEVRNVLARVVAAGRRRIATVIGGKDRPIAGPQRSEQSRELSIQLLERFRESSHIAPMTELRIEIIQVDENEPMVDLIQ